MTPSQRRTVASALVGLTVICPAVVQAQGFTRVMNPIGNQGFNGVNPFFRVAPGMTLPQFAFNSAVLGQALSNIPPYALGYNPYQGGLNYGYSSGGLNPYGTGLYSMTSPYASGYGTNGYSGAYGSGSYSSDPASAYLKSAAELTNANAGYQVTLQEARLLNEQVNQTRADTQQRLYLDAQYRRRLSPVEEDFRAAERAAVLGRARRDPPLAEILSGKALNDLLLHLAAQQGKRVKGPALPLDEGVLGRIHVTPGTNSHVAVIQAEGTLRWPAPLQVPAFAEARGRVDQIVREAVRLAPFNHEPEASLIADLRLAIKSLNQAVVRHVAELSPSEYVESRRYLHHLASALQALEGPNAGNYFSGKWVARGKNVPELVQFMSEQGLQFAPAGTGDEAAYRSLHQALVAFDARQDAVAGKY